MNETKKPKQGKAIRIDYFYNNDTSVMTYETQDLINILKSEMIYYSPTVQKPFNHIHVSDHAAKRWAERVSSSITAQRELEIYINESAVLGRIEYLPNNFGLLNDDIIFHYFTGENECKISSFYGSVRELPALSSIHKLHNYIDIKSDGIHLAINEDRLRNTKVWPLPIFNIRYTGTNGPYMFEIYESKDGEKVCFYVCKNGGVRRSWILNDSKVNLSKSTITAIKIFNGTHGFVI